MPRTPRLPPRVGVRRAPSPVAEWAGAVADPLRTGDSDHQRAAATATWEGSGMRPRGREGGINMDNTSSWDVGVEEGWDERHADDGEEGDGDDSAGGSTVEFKDIPYVDCVLGPGDTLYIPVGWWHYVRSLSISFSVSFWWN